MIQDTNPQDPPVTAAEAAARWRAARTHAQALWALFDVAERNALANREHQGSAPGLTEGRASRHPDAIEAEATQATRQAEALALRVLDAPGVSLADISDKLCALRELVADGALHLTTDEPEHFAGSIAKLDGVIEDLHDLLAPALPTPEQAEAYLAWLHMERRLLARELYPEAGLAAERFAPCGTAGDAWHFRTDGSWRDLPQPSTRALTVLHALGVLPER